MSDKAMTQPDKALSDRELPRFYIEHGIIHDRKTGRHIRGDGVEPGIDEASIKALNDLVDFRVQHLALCKALLAEIPTKDINKLLVVFNSWTEHSEPAIEAIESRFIAYLIDTCEGEVISELFLQQALATMLNAGEPPNE